MSRPTRLERVADALAEHRLKTINVKGERIVVQTPPLELAERALEAAGWPEVMGAREVAELLGRNGSDLRKLPDLPAPEQSIATGRLWDGEKIRPYARSRRARLAARTRAQGDTP